jgi:hypothetical protein
MPYDFSWMSIKIYENLQLNLVKCYNRLSINISAGNLSISLLAVAVIVFSEDFTLITISIVLFHYDNWSIVSNNNTTIIITNNTISTAIKI